MGAIYFTASLNTVNHYVPADVAYEHYYDWPGSRFCRVRDGEMDYLKIAELRRCDHMMQKLSKCTRSIYFFLTKFNHSLKDCVMLVVREK